MPAAGEALPWRPVPGGVELAVRLTPRGGLPRVEGVAEHEGRPVLKLRVSAPPVEGAANLALAYLLAKLLRIPRSAVTLVAGEHGRVKRLHLRGPDLEARLAALVDAGPRP